MISLQIIASEQNTFWSDANGERFHRILQHF